MLFRSRPFSGGGKPDSVAEKTDPVREKLQAEEGRMQTVAKKVEPGAMLWRRCSDGAAVSGRCSSTLVVR